MCRTSDRNRRYSRQNAVFLSSPKGMLIENKIVPFGKIFIIYESRPDVTIEAAVMAFKAGNKIVLKGGKNP